MAPAQPKPTKPMTTARVLVLIGSISALSGTGVWKMAKADNDKHESRIAVLESQIVPLHNVPEMLGRIDEKVTAIKDRIDRLPTEHVVVERKP